MTRSTSSPDRLTSTATKNSAIFVSTVRVARRTDIFCLGLLVPALLWGCEGDAVSVVKGQLRAEPENVPFGTVYLGSTKTTFVSLIAGAQPIAISLEAVSDPEFGVELPPLIPAGATVDLPVHFTPSAVSTWSGWVLIHTDISGAPPVRITMTGEGLLPESCDDHIVCTRDSFDFESGQCKHEELHDACDDGDACTTDDTCLEGRCLGVPLRCDDGVACTRDTCDPALGCVPVPVDEACLDADPCSLDRCTVRGCERSVAPDGTRCGPGVQCNFLQVCFQGSCSSVQVPQGVPCDDGNRCTTGDLCSGQLCRGTPIGEAVAVRAEDYRLTNLAGASSVFGQVYVEGFSEANPGFARTYAVARSGANVGVVGTALLGAGELIAVSATVALYARAADFALLVDTTIPSDPRAINVTPLYGLPSWATAAQGRVYFCGGIGLERLDVRDPQDLQVEQLGPCFGAARGDLMVQISSDVPPVASLYRLNTSTTPALLATHTLSDWSNNIVIDGERALIQDATGLGYLAVATGTSARFHDLSNTVPLLVGLHDTTLITHDGHYFELWDVSDPSFLTVWPIRVEARGNSPRLITVIDDEAVVLINQELLYFPLRPTSRLPTARLSGIGDIEALRARAGGYYLITSQGAALYDPSSLRMVDPAIRPPLIFAQSRLVVDRGQGGLIPAEGTVSPAEGWSVVSPQLQPLQGSVPQYPNLSSEVRFVRSALPCRVFAYDFNTLFRVELCQSVPSEDGTFATLPVIPAFLEFVQGVVDHGDTVAVRHSNYVGLYRADTLERIDTMPIFASSPRRFSGRDARAWVVSSFGWLEYHVATGEQGSIQLPTPYDADILAVHWPRIFLATGPRRDELWVLDAVLGAALFALSLEAPLTDILLEPSASYVAREDGVTQISPICVP